jgi:predicted transcriptional regulator
MDDYVTLAFLVASGFFVALSVALLFRYRRISQRISESSDLGKGLLQSLEERLKKQDMRIVDLMARFEVVQARAMAPPVAPAPVSPTVLASENAPAAPVNESPSVMPSDVSDVATVEPVARPAAQPSESQPASQESRPQLGQPHLDETEVAAVNLLREASLNTRQITDALKKSREHTARVMKQLFDLGLVIRDDSTKPFVYQLTDEGRRFLTAGA